MREKTKRFLNIREIAKLSGVSTATVSRVLNAPDTASEKTRNRVLEIVKKYNYIPNQSARNVFSPTSNTIALFVFDLQNPFYIHMIKELNHLCLENNYTLLICDVEDSLEREQKYFEYCMANRCAGIIYTIGATRDSIGIAAHYDVPIVMIDRSPFKDKNCCSIESDAKKSFKLLTDYLYHLNHRKIGFITADEIFICSKLRLDNFISAMHNLNLEVPDRYIKAGHYNFQSGSDAFDYFYSMEDGPTAIIAANDQVARGFISRAYDLGIHIPDYFSVCGYDAVEYDKTAPIITSIHQNVKEIAKKAFDYITNPPGNDAPANFIVDVSLRIGNTCKRI